MYRLMLPIIVGAVPFAMLPCLWVAEVESLQSARLDEIKAGTYYACYYATPGGSGCKDCYVTQPGLWGTCKDATPSDRGMCLQIDYPSECVECQPSSKICPSVLVQYADNACTVLVGETAADCANTYGTASSRPCAGYCSPGA